MSLPTAAADRKAIPIFSGFVKYFPDAMTAVAELSRIGNDQHNPGKPLHWDRSKSGDEADALQRHLLEHGTLDTDGVRHSAKVAWRAMALLQKEIESERKPKSMMDIVRAEFAPPPITNLERVAAARAAHNADPTTRHGGQPVPDTKFGFTVGDHVAFRGHTKDTRTGVVVGFFFNHDVDYVCVCSDQFLGSGGWLPTSLRKI